MSELFDRIDSVAGGALVGSAGVPVADIVGSLARGQSWEELAQERALAPLDLVAAVAFAGLGVDGADSPPLVQGAPRHPDLASALREEAWKGLFPRSSKPVRLSLAAGLLQVHDFWNESHEAAQLADDLGETSFAAYWHAIAHRREPDPGNAAYWFRRVRRHPVQLLLADRAKPLLEAHGDPGATAQLIKSGEWDSNAFIDFTTSARRGTSTAELARQLQRLEMLALMSATASALAASE